MMLTLLTGEEGSTNLVIKCKLVHNYLHTPVALKSQIMSTTSIHTSGSLVHELG